MEYTQPGTFFAQEPEKMLAAASANAGDCPDLDLQGTQAQYKADWGLGLGIFPWLTESFCCLSRAMPKPRKNSWVLDGEMEGRACQHHAAAVTWRHSQGRSSDTPDLSACCPRSTLIVCQNKNPRDPSMLLVIGFPCDL